MLLVLLVVACTGLLPLAMQATGILPQDNDVAENTQLALSTVSLSLLLFWLHPPIQTSIGSGKLLQQQYMNGYLALAAWFAFGSAFWFAMFALFAAPMISIRTVMFSVLVSDLTFVTVSWELPKWKCIGQVLLQLANKQSATNRREFKVFGSILGCIAGLWLGALPIPLDWDAPWQVWPNSLYVAAIPLWVVGRVAASL